MIARIIPLRRLPRGKDYFDYTVPQNLQHKLQLGQCVSIPFMQSVITGIVADVQKTSATAKLKPIHAILEHEPPLPVYQLQLLHFVAATTGVSLGTATKLFFLNFTKKSIALPTYQQAQTLSDASASGMQEAVANITSAKGPVLLTHEKSIDNLVGALASQEVATKGQVLVLAPLTQEANTLHSALENKLRVAMARFDPGLPASQKTAIATAALNGKLSVVVGTRSALFLPFANLKLVVLLRSESDDYKQSDQNPRYDGRVVALHLATRTKARCVFVATTPRVEDVHASRAGLMRHIHIGASSPLPMPRIINLKDEKMGGRNKLISYVAEEAIRNALEVNQRVVLFVGKKGSTNAVVCKDCGWLAKLVREQDTSATTTRYEIITEIPLTCPNCKGTRLKNLRAGTSAVTKDALELFPDAKTTLIEKEKDAEYMVNAHIIVGTHAIFEKTPPAQLGLVVLIDADLPLFAQGFRASEKAYQLLTRLRAWASVTTTPDFFLQTRFPELTLFTAFQKNEPALFYSEELAMREQFQLPPYWQQVRLMLKGKEGTTQVKGGELHAQLTQHKDALGITLSQVTTQRLNKNRETTVLTISYKQTFDLAQFFTLVPNAWVVDNGPI